MELHVLQFRRFQNRMERLPGQAAFANVTAILRDEVEQRNVPFLVHLFPVVVDRLVFDRRQIDGSIAPPDFLPSREWCSGKGGKS